MRMCSLLLWLAVVGLFIVPASGTTITTENDVTFNNSSRVNGSDPLGLFAKGGGRRAYVEFVLDSTPATSATLNLYSAWNKETAPVNVNVQITGGPGAFNEDTVEEPEINAIEAGFSPTLPQNTFHVDNTPQWYSLDITSFYNAHLGQTVTMAIRVVGAIPADGPIFADHEGTTMLDATIPFTGGTGFGPNIEWVPEPASLLLLVLGAGLIRRRA